MGVQKVDPDEVQRLYLAGQSSKEIADRLRVKYPTVNRVIRDRGLRVLSAEDCRRLQLGQEVEAVETKTLTPDMSLDVAVQRFGATHAGRAAIADWAGLQLRRVEQEWHRQRRRRRA